MERLRRCSICIGLMVLASLTCGIQASDDDIYEMHRVKKGHEIMRYQRRDASCEYTGWSLCPASVGGGCCPDGYTCDTESCAVATAGPTTACGKANWYGCPIDKGLGCCPLGTICGEDRKCILPDGSPYAASCPASYSACAATQGGCCKSGLACGDGYCYETTPSTFLISSTVTTTNSDGNTITTTVTEETVITPGPGPGTTDSSRPLSTIAMVIPTTLPKLESHDVDNSQSNGGLTNGQVGGIVAGIVIILIAILAATFFIIRRLKKTAKIVAVTESKRDTSSGQHRSRKTSFGQPTVTEVDGFDVDPLTQSPSVRPSHLRSESDSSFTERSPNHTPNIPSTSSTPPVWSGQYHAAPPISEVPSEGREYSMDSSRGAYDVSRFSQQTAQTQCVSYDSQSQMSHSRQHSDASELSGLTVDGPGKMELESNAAIEQEIAASRRRASTSAAAAARPPPPPASSHARRGSGGAARGRSESAAAAISLSTVTEFSELHGYYGPSDQTVGETADRLGRGASTASSTVSRDQKEAAARLRRGDSSVSATPTEAYRKNSGPPQ